MKKSLTQKLAVILLSTFSSALFSLAQLPVVHADTTCAADVNKMDITQLKSCKTEVETKIKDLNSKAYSNEGLTDEEAQFLEKIQDLPSELDLKIMALNVAMPVDKYVETELNITDLSSDSNLCISKDSKIQITTIIEEPLDIEIPKEQENSIKNCVRNTFCVKRETESKTACISYIDREGFCSEEASKHVEKNSGTASLNCSPVQMFLSSSGTDMLFIYISAIYRWAAGVLGIIAVLIVVISGIQISAAGGDQTTVTNAKNRIVRSLGGLVILFLSAIILYTINPTFFTR